MRPHTDPDVTATVWVTTSFVAFHRWPHAPDAQDYLRDRHRHRFGVRVEVEATPDDARTVEFHALLDHVRDTLDGWEGKTLTSMSCECMAAVLISELTEVGYRVVTVSVDEDGECGATLSTTPPWA